MNKPELHYRYCRAKKIAKRFFNQESGSFHYPTTSPRSIAEIVKRLPKYKPSITESEDD